MIHGGSQVSAIANGTLARHTALRMPPGRPAFLRQIGKNSPVIITVGSQTWINVIPIAFNKTSGVFRRKQ
jgi:hypothetical protein